MKGFKKLEYKIEVRLRDDYRKIGNKLFSKIRRKKLYSTKFSIISNNCWGGHVYQYFGLPYLSPTVGLWIPPKDFIRFVKDFDNIIKKDLEELKIENCCNSSLILKKFGENIPILGKIGNVEIVFLHYKTFEEAKEKWERRKKRLTNNLIFKLNDNNEFEENDYVEWEKLECNKVFFTNEKNKKNNPNVVYLKLGLLDEKGVNDTATLGQGYNLIRIINDRIKL